LTAITPPNCLRALSICSSTSDAASGLARAGNVRDVSGRYVAATRTVIYSPSATSFYLLTEQKRSRTVRNALLAIGGVPYARSAMNRSGLTRGFNRNGFVDLPSSADEVRIAQAAFPRENVDLLMGTSATETALKRLS
jgi:hypothetical protein